MDDVTIIHGDCLDVLPTLEAGSVDAVITDPPYGIVNKFGSIDAPSGKRSLEFEWDSAGDMPEIVGKATDLALGLLSDRGAAIVFCGLDCVDPIQRAFRRHGLTPKPFAWVKLCPPPPMKGNWWPSGFELAIYGYKPGAWFGDSRPNRSNVAVFDAIRNGNGEKNGHPTQKPFDLMKLIVSSICPPGGMVLDCFAGSGTTPVACMKTGRRCVAIEREAKYVEIIHRRVAEARTPLFDLCEAAS